MYYMRVAQMYLIKAEAMARTNASIRDCLDVLNVLRLRSGNTTFEAADYSSPSDVLEEVFRENVREIRMEKRGYILSRRKIYRKRSSEVERHEPELRA